MYMAQIEETFCMFQGICVSQSEWLRPIKQMKAKAGKAAVQDVAHLHNEVFLHH